MRRERSFKKTFSCSHHFLVIICFLGCWFGLQRFFRCCTFSSQLRRIQITLQTSWSHEGFLILSLKEAAKFLRHVPMYQCTIDIYMTSFSKLLDFHPTFRKIHTRRNAAKPPSWRNPAWHLASQAMNLWQSPKVLIPLGRRVIPWLQAHFFFGGDGWWSPSLGVASRMAGWGDSKPVITVCQMELPPFPRGNTCNASTDGGFSSMLLYSSLRSLHKWHDVYFFWGNLLILLDPSQLLLALPKPIPYPPSEKNPLTSWIRRFLTFQNRPNLGNACLFEVVPFGMPPCY